jgi:hypothetical protein
MEKQDIICGKFKKERLKPKLWSRQTLSKGFILYRAKLYQKTPNIGRG